MESHDSSLQDLCYGVGGMVAPYIAILVHRHSWDVLATVDLVMAFWVIRRRACIGCWEEGWDLGNWGYISDRTLEGFAMFY